MRKLRSRHNEELLAVIRAAIRNSPDARHLHRLHCVLLADLGPGCYEVARWFGEDPRTIERWVHVCERAGPEGLKDHHGGGRPARLNESTARMLAEELSHRPGDYGFAHSRWSGALLAEHLERSRGIRLSARQCQRILRRLLAPTPVPASA